MKKDIVIKMSDVTETTPIAELVALANKFESKIYFEKDDKRLNAKSIMGMMSMVLGRDVAVTIDADGEDAPQAIEALEEFLTK